MATVRALKQCFIGSFREVGDVFEYVGPRAAHLELLDGEFVSTAARPQLDHDKDGKEGGAAAPAPPAPVPPAAEPARTKKAADPERAAIIAALKAANIKYFAGAPTEKLKTLLPG